jgi:hypothetical protein
VQNDCLTTGIRTLNEAIDREIGLMLQQRPVDANVVIVSSLGLHDHYPTGGLMEAFCDEWGYRLGPSSDTGILARCPDSL